MTTQARRRRVLQGKNTFFAVVIGIVVIAMLLGGYHLPIFFMDLGAKHIGGPQEWLENRSPLAWVVSLGLLIGMFFVLRAASQYVAEAVKFIFKIGQYDVVTMILAVVVNGLFMWLASWMTKHLISFMDDSGVSAFFSSDNAFSVAILFIMISGAMIWFPRTGDRYSENKFGQMDG